MKIRINFRGQKQQELGDRIPVDGEKTEAKARSSSVSDKKRKIRAWRGLRPHGLRCPIGRTKSREPRHTSGEDTRRADCSNEMTTRNASAVRKVGPNEAAQGHASRRPDTREKEARWETAWPRAARDTAEACASGAENGARQRLYCRDMARPQKRRTGDEPRRTKRKTGGVCVESKNRIKNRQPAARDFKAEARGVLLGKPRRSTSAAVRRDLREREMSRCTACLRASGVENEAEAASVQREAIARSGCLRRKNECARLARSTARKTRGGTILCEYERNGRGGAPTAEP
jgi:hypothetical protein